MADRALNLLSLISSLLNANAPEIESSVVVALCTESFGIKTGAVEIVQGKGNQRGVEMAEESKEGKRVAYSDAKEQKNRAHYSGGR